MTEERDLRRYARNTQRHLVLGVVVLLFILGDGLVFVIYGREAGILALICTALGLCPIFLIALSLWIVERLAKRTHDG